VDCELAQEGGKQSQEYSFEVSIAQMPNQSNVQRFTGMSFTPEKAREVLILHNEEWLSNIF
jgi:hypothetical protein